jgi:hypothetical protein
LLVAVQHLIRLHTALALEDLWCHESWRARPHVERATLHSKVAIE